MINNGPDEISDTTLDTASSASRPRRQLVVVQSWPCYKEYNDTIITRGKKQSYKKSNFDLKNQLLFVALYISKQLTWYDVMIREQCVH